MTSTPTSPTNSAGLLEELYRGRLRWDLLRPFPEEDAQDLLAGQAAVQEVRALLREHVDPDEIAGTGTIPAELVGLLRKKGYFNLLVKEGGGLDLSIMNAVRVIEAMAAYSPALGLLVGNSNGFGAACYLPLVEPGELRDLIERHVEAGSVGGTADTEVIGAANEDRTTTAELVEDGAAYLISGEKVYIGTGMAAHLLDVSAVVTAANGDKQIRVFFVETDAPGVSVLQQEFMGLAGAPLAVVRLDKVRVPAGHLLPAAVDAWRDDADLVRLAVVGRMLNIAPSAMAIAKLCLSWSREFVARRAIDGRGLGEYEEIKRHLAQTAADAYAIESVVLWGLLSGNLAERSPELTVAKNLISLACWNAADRTVSLFGGEGYETAASKARRGGAAIPLERFYRDTRSMRISGGVDFLLDIWTAVSALKAVYGSGGDDAPGSDGTVAEPALPARCRQHLDFLQQQAGELAAESRRMVADGLGEGWTDAAVRNEHRLMLAGRISGLLLGMGVVLARTAQLAEGEDAAAAELAGELADLVCADYRSQLAEAWAELRSDPAPDFVTVGDRVLAGEKFAAV
ncbi:MAG: acyl-CoA/acyl-ACP dehydrogenase, partial [Actinobacteria bacterium]|nr:acyl-CoA/acyl-ACP dehydrogenase [Actinomycetota bacterium]